MKRILFFLLLVSGVVMGQKVVIKSTAPTLDNVKKAISDSLNATNIVFSLTDFYGSGTSANNLRVKGKADSATVATALAAISGGTGKPIGGTYDTVYYDATDKKIHLIQGGYNKRLAWLDSTSITTSIAFLTSGTPASSTINNFGGDLGYQFTVGSSAITIDSVGRWVVSGNTGAHTVRLVVGGTTVASASIATSGATAGQYKYAAITPYVAAPGTVIKILSLEVSGGDFFYGESTVTSTGVATVNGSHYSFDSGATTTQNSAGSVAFIPVNFKYH